MRAADLQSNTAPASSAIVPPQRSSSRGPPSTEDLHKTTSKTAAASADTGAAAPEAQPKKKRSFLNIPRSSSQSHDEQTPTGTGLSGATVADSDSIGRASKRSFMGKRRAGSTASSKRSQQQSASKEKAEPVPAVPAEHREGSTRSKTRKAGGLLACLPCFAPRDASPAGEEPAPEAAKQAPKPKPGRTSQPTPLKKQEIAESSTADSKEPIDEKAASESYGADQTEKPAHSDGATDPPSHENPPRIVTRSSSQKQSSEQPLPPLPNQPGSLQTGHPQINIQTPTPGTTPITSRPSEDQQQIIDDRTEEQKQTDTDIVMHEPGSAIASTEVRHEGDAPAEEAKPDEQQPKITALPPPPPLEQRQQGVRDQASVNSETESVNQKWLLGPIQPEFKGKKCLVLDLDETLVHSSFKVSRNFTVFASGPLRP